MWFFTEVADGFDRLVHEDEVFLDNWGTEAAAKSLRDEGSIELVAASIVSAGFKFSTTVSKGLLDVLRIGDGVKKGGWGYGQDALRALVLVGPALRGVRMASGLVASVDAEASMGNCAWVAAARGARLSGRLFASIKDVARFAGMTLPETGGVKTLEEVMLPLRMMGADAEMIAPEGKTAFSTMEEVFKAAAQRRDGTLTFGVKWLMNGKPVGHALIARWGIAGVRIIDRSGAVVRSLAELEASYPGIGSATPIGRALFVANSITTKALSTVPSVLSMLAVEVKPAVVNPATARPPASGSSGTPPTRSLPQQLKTSKHMGRVTVHTTCIAPNTESPQVCIRYYTYQVVPGDSLSKIAGCAYKDESRWQIIYKANKDLIGPNPNVLKSGVELFIPSR
jgi:nucleoid-associated protein YgaU